MADTSPRHLAVLISGQVRHANVSFFAPNPVLGLSPLQLYVRMRHSMPSPWRAELFLCAERPVSGHPALEHADFAGVWAFNASSQFERLALCLQHVDRHHHRAHDAFLRVRPDMLMLGPLPPSFFPADDPRAVLVKWNRYNPAFIRGDTLREHVICGACDQFCECAQRKYGQVLYHFSDRNDSLGHDRSRGPGHCGLMTDMIFGFGRALLPNVLKVLRFYSGVYDNATAWPRAPWNQPAHCVDAGRMTETGLQRLLDLENVTYVPLALRTALGRQLQPDTPSWASMACMLNWGAQPVRCSAPCEVDSYTTSGKYSSPAHALQLPPFCPMATKGQWAGCNPVSKNWDNCKAPPAATNRTWAYPPPWTGHQSRR